MASRTNPAIEAKEFVSDYRWPSYAERLRARREVLLARLAREHPPEYPAMCGYLGELRGINFALGLPVELTHSDPRSET